MKAKTPKPQKRDLTVVGLDVSRESFTLAVLEPKADTPRAESAFPNTEAGWQDAVAWTACLETDPTALLWVMEATGTDWLLGAYTLHAQGCPVSVVNPQSVHAFGQAQLRRAKTDRLDARLIALYGQRMRPALWQPYEHEHAQLRVALRTRAQLQNHRHELALQRRACAAQGGSPSTLACYELLDQRFEEQLKQLEAEIRAFAQSQPAWREALKLWQTVPGVGFWTACTLLAEVRSLDTFEAGRSLVRYAGLSPAVRQSGKRRGYGAGLSSHGNRWLRRMFYMAALSNVRSQGGYGGWYRSLRARGKSGKEALCAVARKIVMVLYAIERNKTGYDPLRFSPKGT